MAVELLVAETEDGVREAVENAGFQHTAGPARDSRANRPPGTGSNQARPSSNAARSTRRRTTLRFWPRRFVRPAIVTVHR